MARLKAICVVAHPDDCVIFARPFIRLHNQFDWTILYLTYAEYEPRGKEIADFWKNQGVTTVHLGFNDTHLDMENDRISFNSEQAAREIVNIVHEYDLVLTHNPDGEYNHIHHKFVSFTVSATGKPVVYFARPGQQNYICNLKENLDLELLPLHREVISMFDDINLGRYVITKLAKEVIDGKPKTEHNLHL